MVKCYRSHELRGLEGKSSRPKRVRERQWTCQQAQAVLHLRQHFKTWGKRKIWKILVRDQGMNISEMYKKYSGSNIKQIGQV